MTAPGTRFERTDYQHMARVLEARAQRDRIDPLWSRRLLDARRLAPRRVALGE